MHTGRARRATWVAAGLVSAVMTANHATAFAQETTNVTPNGPAAIVVENEFARLELGGDARTAHLIDKATGKDYGPAAPGQPIARIALASGEQPATAITRRGDNVRIEFGASGVSATLRLTAKKTHFILEVVAVDGKGVDTLTFVDIPLSLKGQSGEPFAACALALNLKTNVHEIPQPNARLRAMAYSRFGFEGAAVALVACPTPRLRDIMKDVVTAAPDLPHSPLGGPWAYDAKVTHGSYLMDVQGSVTEETVDQWIELARSVGIKQLDFHTGHSLRFGDYVPNPKLYPRGMDSLRAVIDRLHAAGILAGLHTYAHFVAKDSRWVSPVPDPRLGAKAVFTLAADIPADATTIPVNESTKDVSTITGFFVRNSVTLRIDEELIVFRRVASESPFGFLECERGAWGTKPAAHARGAKAHHLWECFGLFAPDGDSTLLAEVAARTAEVYNDAGFDMIYMDALDGSDVLGGGPYAWYYGSKFVFEIARRLKKPAIMEMSTFHHHLWYVRSRMGAWDAPSRGYKRFVDIHTIVNRSCQRMFLPPHLGWWAAHAWTGTLPERTFPEDIEYLCCKCIGTDAGLSLIGGFTPTDYASRSSTRRLGAIVKQYEAVRLDGRVPEEIRRKLAVLGDEFTLVTGDAGQPRFRPIEYHKHRVDRINDDRGVEWTVQNRFGAQPVRLRIESLLGMAPYDAKDAITIAAFENAAEFATPRTQTDVQAKLDLVTEPVRAGGRSARLRVTSTHARPDAAWAVFEKKFETPVNLKDRGFGLWIHGDGQGEVLNFQIQSPPHLSLAIVDRYVTIDFSGWRYVELIEPESDRIVEYAWPYACRRKEWESGCNLMGFAYPTLFYHINWEQIATLSVWVNNVPTGKTVECLLSPVQATPVQPITLRNPAVTINGARLVFPAELPSGSYIEFRSPTDCKVYDKLGDLVGDVKPQGDVPELRAGENRVRFECETPDRQRPRAAVTVIDQGEPL